MERTTLALIALCLVLLFAQFFLQENFTGTVGFRPIGCPDASGNKSIANCVFSIRQQCTDPTNPSKRVPCIGEPGDTDYSDASGNRVLCYNADMQPTGLCPDTAYRGIDIGTGMGASDEGESGGWGSWGDTASAQGPPSHQGASGRGYGAQFASLRNDIRDDIRRTIKKEVAKSCSSAEEDEECAVSPAADQGAQFLKEVYGQDPNKYIKKDSIPCYGCSLP